jgi:23S rRNA (uracil1939-C5)-methyltransferase
MGSDESSRPPDEPYGRPFSVTVDRIAKGGSSLGAGPDGRVVFVAGAIPGERLEVEATEIFATRVEALPTTVVEPSTDRVEPPCAHARLGWSPSCGGCDWQHIGVDRQRVLRSEIVADCLRRLAGLEAVDIVDHESLAAAGSVPIVPGPALKADGYRTTVRAAVSQGRAAFRRRRSNDLVVVDECVVAHPLVEDLLREGRFGDAEEVTVRVGANTGERMVIMEPTARGAEVPDGVVVVGRDELMAGRRPHIHEELGGRRLQISADSFFQCRADGALALAQTVGDLLAPFEGTMLDAYCGVGLFGSIAGMGRQIIGVESSSSAVADAAWNLGPHSRVVESRMERWHPEPVGVVVADPARSGLKAQACDRLVETGAAAVALVSCDPAALARDTTLLSERGLDLHSVRVFDLFGHTSHVETVSLYRRR